jgi:preprotein translocase subunit SecE
MRKVVTFFKDSYAELKKVVWPSREEVGSSTRVVLISVALFAIVLGIVDFLFLTGIDLIF